MINHLNKILSKPFGDFIYLLFFTSLAAPLILSTNVVYQLDDSFHEGEYVGALWHILKYYDGEVKFPIFIHGAMDYIPSLIASKIFGFDRIIVGTRIINNISVLIAWVLFFDLSRRLTIRSWISYCISLLPFFALFIAFTQYNEALSLHHSIIGPRDFFLIFSIWSFIVYLYCLDLVRKRLFAGITVILCIFSFFWSYDRGIMSIPVMLAVFALTWRQDKISLWINIFIISIFVSVNETTVYFGGFLNNLKNIIYWVKNSNEVWSNKEIYPITAQVLLLPASVIAVIPLVIFAFVADWKRKDKRAFIVICILFIIEILLIKTILNRPGLPRTTWALWPLFIIFVYGFSRVFLNKEKIIYYYNIQNLFDIKFISLILPLYIIFLTFSNYFFTHPNINNINSFYSALKKPISDRSLINSDLLKASLAVGNNNKSCALLWSNEGIISLIAKLPICSDFFYSAYAASAYDKKIVESLKTNPPTVIVAESPYWSIKIDGKRMHDRFPSLWKYIEDKYPYTTQIGGYVLRTATKNLIWTLSSDKLDFSIQGHGQIFLSDGWFKPESWGVWAEGNHANIKLQIPDDFVHKFSLLKLTVKGFVVLGKSSPQSIEVFINGNKVDDVILMDDSLTDIIIKIPVNTINQKYYECCNFELSFKMKDAVSPSSLKLSDDVRKLSLGLVAIEFLRQ